MRNSAISKKLFITGGTFGRRFTKDYDGKALLFDTESAVMHDDGPERHAIHLQPDLGRTAPADVPTLHVGGAGRDGAALDSSFALRALLSDAETHERLLHAAVQRADLVHMLFSRGGGTGNGVCEPVISWVATRNCPARLILITALDPTVNPVKQARFLRDHIRGLPSNVTSVVAREASTVQEILDVQVREWAVVTGLLRNMPRVPADSELRVLQVRRIALQESEIVDAVIEGLLQRDIPERWRHGAANLPHHEVQRAVNEVRDVLDDLERRNLSASIPMNAVLAAARHGAQTLTNVADGIVAQVANAVQSDVDADIAFLEERIPRIGLNRVPSFEPMVARWEQRVAEVRDQTETADWDATVRRAAASQGWVSRVRASVRGRDDDDQVQAVAELTRNAVESENTQYVTRRLRELSTPPVTARPDTRVLHLPATSPLVRDFVDAYFAPKVGEPRLAALRLAIGERLPEVIVAALAPELPTLARLDFETTFEARANTGLVLGSRFGAEISGLAAGLHTDPMFVATPVVESTSVEIVHFGLVRRVRDVPVFADLAEKVNRHSASSADRHLFVQRARDIFPTAIRDTRGVALDEAALVVAKAAIVPGLLRITHGQEVEVTIRGTTTFSANHDRFQSFADSLMPIVELDIHDGFWAYFAADRPRCRTEISGLAARETGRHDAARIAALEKFVGVKRWQAAIARLAADVDGASGFWQ